MMSHELISLGILALYFTSSLVSIFGMIRQKNVLKTAGCTICAAAFLAQTTALVFGFHRTFSDGLSGGAYMQMVAWFVALASLILWFRYRQTTAIGFAAPLSTLLFALSLAYMKKGIPLPASLDSSFYVLHIGCLFICLAVLSVSFLVSALFLYLEREIKNKRRLQGFLNDIPALSILDAINGFCIIVSFPLYTIGLVTGLLRAKPIFGATFTGDPKEVISLIIWGILAFVFHNRLARSWTGRKPAITMFTIFLLSLFSFLVINTVMGSHHTFMSN